MAEPRLIEVEHYKEMDIYGTTDRNGDTKLCKSSIIPPLCENVMTQRKIERRSFIQSLFGCRGSAKTMRAALSIICVLPQVHPSATREPPLIKLLNCVFH